MDAILSEILSEIFLHSLSDVVGPVLVKLPLQLTHICRSWRAAALSTPRMWSRLDLEISEENAPLDSALLSTWITRSRACPLDIRLSWDRPPFSSHHPALEILARCSDRWEEMMLYLPRQAFKGGPLAVARGNIPQLIRLSVGVSNVVERMDSSRLDIFSIAPKLISFQVFTTNCDPTSFQIPWGQLTHLPITWAEIGGSIRILQLSPKLREATFLHHNFYDSRPYPVVLHSSLQSLFITQKFPSGELDYSDLFLNVALPNLRSLTINSSPPSLIPATLTTFLSRITALDHLNLRGCVINDTALSQSLEVTQSLTYLDLRDLMMIGEDNFLVRAKSRTDGIGGSGDFVLVPKLKILAIRISGPGLELFTELVEHRAETLRKVYLQTDQQLDPHLRNRLEKVRSQTLSVTLL